jgi:hypothetical protein
MCLEVPAEILRRMWTHGITSELSFFRWWIIFGNIPDSITVWILITLSLWWKIAQKQSAKTYLSVSLPVATIWHKTGIANLTCWCLGRGLPRHKLEIAQQHVLIYLSSLSLSMSWIKLISPPARTMLSR